MGVSGPDSDDTVILSEDESPASKRQRSDDVAKVCKFILQFTCQQIDFNTVIISQLIETILKKKPGGEVVIREYSKTKSLTDSTRRQMINILVSEMTETHG